MTVKYACKKHGFFNCHRCVEECAEKIVGHQTYKVLMPSIVTSNHDIGVLNACVVQVVNQDEMDKLLEYAKELVKVSDYIIHLERAVFQAALDRVR